jgi:hypothetical protein
MQGLLRRLSTIDSEAERALRIVEFFDQLVFHAADVSAISRATAVLAEAKAGVHDHANGLRCAHAPSGEAVEQPAGAVHELPVLVDEEVVGVVWLHRAGEPNAKAWDEFLLERMSLAVAAAISRRRSPRRAVVSGLADPAIMQHLLTKEVTELDASRSALLLGYQVGQQVRVAALVGAAITGSLADCRAAVGHTSRQVSVAALSDSVAAMLLGSTPADRPALPAGVVACIGPAVPIERAYQSWIVARRGARFAGLSPRWPCWLDSGELGCVIALDGQDGQDIPELEDVRAVARIAAGRSGASDLSLLEAVCTAGSIRDAATELHMHHSSVAYRVRRLGDRIGFGLAEPHLKYRARTALLLWQLHVADR